MCRFFAGQPTSVNNAASVLFRCIGDLSTLQCKSSNTNTVARDDEACVRNPEAAQKTLLNSATALDSYVGWIAASWVTFFTRNERDTHICWVGAL
ncbi:unnamed protein product [Leptidea sinapis]|uniref:Uncharacterized protein n=1 Tax=Leptidea sinapis TaxID=189913 RepID=A0A5E4Q133_9NEOP|nr:unnamed protein product [Leptidea sinapis]